MKYKVVIVGCGKIAGRYESREIGSLAYGHAAAYQNNGNFELKGCVDVSKDRTVWFGQKYLIPHSGTDLSSVVDLVKPDVVSVTTPDDTHFQIVEELLENPNIKPSLIFLEKPALSTKVELETLIRLTELKNVPIVVNHTRRFHPLYRAIKKKYGSGVFGRLVRVDSTYYGGWRHSAIHLVDIVQYLFSQDIFNPQIIEKISTGLNNDSTFTVRAILGSQKIPVWFHGWDDIHYQLFDLEFRFSKGRLRITNFEQEVVWEESYKNSMGERVLRPKNMDCLFVTKSAMTNAVAVISDYLDSKNISLLKGVLLSDIVSTMDILWEVGN